MSLRVDLFQVKPDSEHNLVATGIRLLGRFAPYRLKRAMKGRRVIDLRQLMASPRLRRALTDRTTPLPPGTDGDGMAMVFAEAMLSTAAHIVPRA